MKLFSKKNSKSSYEQGVQIVTAGTESSLNNEQFNSIRTNIKFANVDQVYKKIMITSSHASEGKSTVAANVAVAFAKQGMKTLLVDTDFRRPTVTSTFSILKSSGLTNLLTTKDFDISKIIYQTTFPNLFVLPSGPIPPNPSELMGSNKMKELLKKNFTNFDLVIFDAPPLLPVTDAQILSTMVDGTILVVRAGVSEKGWVTNSVKLLNEVGSHLMGTILNDVAVNSENNYSSYYKKE